MSGMMRSMPGRSAPAKATPRSTASQALLCSEPRPYSDRFMPISPTPPSGAKTSSSFLEIIGAMVHCGRPRSSPPSRRQILGDRKHLPRGNDLAAAVAEPQDEPAGFVDRLEMAAGLAFCEPHPAGLAETDGPRQPARTQHRAPRTAL